jgi:hypothetical protein
MATSNRPDDMGFVIPPGHGNRSLGPGDSSDSGSDMGPSAPDTDTDSMGTGERADVEGDTDDTLTRDIDVDEVVDEKQAGLAHTPPDPARNGG